MSASATVVGEVRWKPQWHPAARRRGGARALVAVDDQPLFRQVTRAIIDRLPGFELVGEAADGEAALRLARRVDPDMVIVDVRMSGIDGIETARRLTAEDATRVVILVSSADVRQFAELAGSSGAALVRKDWLTPRLVRGLWVAHRRR